MKKINILILIILFIIFVVSTIAAINEKNDRKLLKSLLKKADEYIIINVGSEFFNNNVVFSDIILKKDRANKSAEVFYTVIPLEKYGKFPLVLIASKDSVGFGNKSVILPNCQNTPEYCQFNLTKEDLDNFINIYQIKEISDLQPPNIIAFACPDNLIQINYNTKDVYVSNIPGEINPSCK